jgi:steroid 5-alpha reductase family enzyme
LFDLNIYAGGLAATLIFAVSGWLYSLARDDVSVADSLWSLLFLVMMTTYLALAPALAERAYLLLFLVTIWAVRLSIFITLRNSGQPEDRRYRALRAKNEPGFPRKSLYLVFGVQAVLAWIISLPLLGVVLGGRPLGVLDSAATLLWLIGFGFETLADQQLARFRSYPANNAKVLTEGLWRYTRHPNYFGEVCMWWAYYLFAVSAGAWWTVVGPLLLTFMLLKVSGIALVEESIRDRRPDYAAYAMRTNALFPGPPKA